MVRRVLLTKPMLVLLLAFSMTQSCILYGVHGALVVVLALHVAVAVPGHLRTAMP